jgi:hypothetical protein
MTAAEARIAVGTETVSASLHGTGETLVALGHGAGSTRRTPFLLRCADDLAASGRAVLLFNFPYSEARRRFPDPAPVLEACVAAVAGYARAELGARRLVLGGRSMGGRMASRAAAAGLACEGLVLFGYPLHPPKQPERVRDAHLYDLRPPLLFVQGTRDAFARWELLQGVLARLGPRATLHQVEGGDHSFAVPRRGGRRPEEVEAAIFAAVRGWLEAHGL